MFLNCGFGEPLSAVDLELVRSLGFSGIRQNVPTAGRAAELVDNVLDAGLSAIFIVPVEDEGACQAVAHAVAERAVGRGLAHQAVLEVGNEEDLRAKRWAKDPTGWAALVRDVASIAWGHGGSALRVVSGGVSSVSRTALGWLARSRVREIPVAIGYHQYRSTPPGEPLDGYDSRGAEFEALRAAAAGRDLWCTESGWHTAPRSSGWGPFKRTWAYTDEQVLDFMTAEAVMNARAGALCFVQYQLADGPTASDQDCFGIRTFHGAMKRSSLVAHRLNGMEAP